MLERIQSALKSVKDSKPSTLLSHRFVTVRRGTPAARSGQIQPGDQLEAVEGRSVLTLPHRDLAQLLRRAGNTLRLTIIPRSSTNSSSLSESTEFEPEHRTRKGHRTRPKQDSRFYSVDLERGPTGFGFSLRGGSEYHMGLYVLGLMEGGPASRSHKIQVSDQLVEINGDSTSGMTHGQAVEQIRRGGHRIHLVLKKGNGYVPDYDREAGALSPSSLLPKESGVAAVDNASLLPAATGQPVDGRRRVKERERKGGRLGGRSGRGGGERRGNRPEDREAMGRGRSRRSPPPRSEEREKRTQSLPPQAGKNRGESEEDRRRGRRDEKRRIEKEESGGMESRGRERVRRRREVEEDRRMSLPLGDGRRTRGHGEQTEEELWRAPSGGPAGEGAAFSFLLSLDDDPSDAESEVSVSEVSVSAASISGVSSVWLDPGSDQRERAPAPPGPWLQPSRWKLSQVLDGSRLSGRGGGL